MNEYVDTIRDIAEGVYAGYEYEDAVQDLYVVLLSTKIPAGVHDKKGFVCRVLRCTMKNNNKRVASQRKYQHYGEIPEGEYETTADLINKILADDIIKYVLSVNRRYGIMLQMIRDGYQIAEVCKRFSLTRRGYYHCMNHVSRLVKNRAA